jgi:hypothetical protein
MQRGQSRQQKSHSLEFSELPSLPSAGDRPGCFHTSLGCKPRSLIKASLGWFDYSKRCEEGQFNSGLFASKRSKASQGSYSLWLTKLKKYKRRKVIERLGLGS